MLGKLSVPGVQLIWIIVGQVPIELAAGAGVSIWTIFSRLSFFISPSLEDGPK